MAVTAALLSSCGGAKTTTAEADKFDYTVEQFADLQILRYKVPGFEELTLKQKELIYYLTEAALEGRDILPQKGMVLQWYSPPLRYREICAQLLAGFSETGRAWH